MIVRKLTLAVLLLCCFITYVVGAPYKPVDPHSPELDCGARLATLKDNRLACNSHGVCMPRDPQKDAVSSPHTCHCDTGYITVQNDINQACMHAQVSYTYLLAMQVFFGWVGAGHFILGHIGTGIVQAFLGTLLLCAVGCACMFDIEFCWPVTRYYGTYSHGMGTAALSMLTKCITVVFWAVVGMWWAIDTLRIYHNRIPDKFGVFPY